MCKADWAGAAVLLLLLLKSSIGFGFSPSLVMQGTSRSTTLLRASSSSMKHISNSNSNNDKDEDNHDLNEDSSTNSGSDRRRFLSTIMKTTAATTVATATISGASQPASAFQKAYPVDLDFVNGDTSRDLQAVREEAIARKKKNYKKSMDYVTDTNPFALFRGPKDIITAAAWGGALWVLTGSRSNPLVTPLANALYNDEKEEQKWLKDRNDGLFASLPLPLFGALIIVFFGVGIVTDRIFLYLADGDANVSLQLATVSFISGASLELGRIASGEKKPTRDEFDRSTLLRNEFDAFATSRLQFGGSCHRNDVVRAFRRYYAKYRQEDSDEYPLANLEIEKLLREWSRLYGGGRAQMTSAGFYNGLSVNLKADIFVER